MLTCTQLHTHARTFPPCALIHSKAHSSHTHIIQASLFPLLLSLPATLPLGGVSWNGLKELAPCTWSALFTRTYMWAGRIVESPQSPSELGESIWGADGSGQPSVSHPCHIWANLFGDLLFGKFLFFWPATPSPPTSGHVHSACFLPEGSFFSSLYSKKRDRVKCWFSWFVLWMKWRGAGHRILKDNLATPPRHTHTLPARLLPVFCESRHHMLISLLTVGHKSFHGCFSLMVWEKKKSGSRQENTDYKDLLLHSEWYISNVGL